MPEQVLRATLDVPFECAFSKAGVMNGIPSYEVPPIPTIQGLLYAALGRPSLLRYTISSEIGAGDVESEEAFRQTVQEECRIGLRIDEPGDQHRELRSRMKRTSSKKDQAYETTPTQVESLIAPTYRVFVGGPESYLEQFETALTDPERLLYLGRSDDIVDVRDVDLSDVDRVEQTATVDCVIPKAGEAPTLLPVEPDHRDGRSTKPARVETVSLTGGEVDHYFETADGERFVYVT